MTEHVFLQEALKIPELRVEGVEIKQNAVGVRAEVILEKGLCSECGHICTDVHQYLERTIRHLPICGMACYITFREKQYKCRGCEKTFTPELDFVLDQNRRVSKLYGEHLFMRVRGTSIKIVAEQEKMAEKTVEEIYYLVARQKEQGSKREDT